MMRTWWSLCQGLCLELGSRYGVMGHEDNDAKKTGVDSGVGMVCFQVLLIFLVRYALALGIISSSRVNALFTFFC